MGDAAAYLLLVPCVVAIYALARRFRPHRRQHFLPLPPGPKKLPLLGNLFDLPSERQWEAYQQWSEEYGSDIIHLDIAGTSIIVLSSVEATRELFEKRSSIYSDRAHSPMLVELMGWDWSIGLMKYGPMLREHRKIMHDSFNSTTVKQFRAQETVAVHALLRRLLHDPQNIMAHFRQMTGGLIMDIAYGIKVAEKGDPYIDMVTEAMRGLATAAAPGAFLVDTIPALKYVPSWLPGAGFKRRAAEWRKVTRGVLELPFIQTQKNIALGTASKSFTSLNLQNLNANGKDKHNVNNPEDRESVIRNTAANVYAGGADTTVSALGWFVFGMLSNPAAQAKAQAELDAVLGHGNLPTFDDQTVAALPYVNALVKEVLRWRNVTPIGVPHYVNVEDEYRGYRVPAGSIVIGNVWALLHDKDVYPNPNFFNPDRFMHDGKLDTGIRDPDTVAFGFGRRICPGKHLATAILWMTIASILATFTIEKSVDEQGKVIEPTYEYFAGIVSTPTPFECRVTPRSKEVAHTIHSTNMYG
ncbi:cytochrome P450 [Mycena amicta]|nr:cytochrome P450 [Mycena amicta]